MLSYYYLLGLFCLFIFPFQLFFMIFCLFVLSSFVMRAFWIHLQMFPQLLRSSRAGTPLFFSAGSWFSNAVELLRIGTVARSFVNLNQFDHWNYYLYDFGHVSHLSHLYDFNHFDHFGGFGRFSFIPKSA